MAFIITADEVLFPQAAKLLARGLKAIEMGETEIDLSQATTCDSSLLACILAWRRAAERAGNTLKIRHPPTNLLRLAELYRIHRFIS